MAGVMNLRMRVTWKTIVIAPGVYDAFTALVAEPAGLLAKENPEWKSCSTL